MRRFITALLAVASLGLFGLGAQPAIATTPEPSGTLSLQNSTPTVGDVLKFNYSTNAPDALNWIALYDNPADGPSDQTYHAPSTTWDRAAQTSGTLSLSSAKLTVGHDVVAYFLAKDGYTWLAKPVTFRLSPAGATGTLALLNQSPTQGDDLKFSYSTDRVNSLNWIGLYDNPATGPSDGKNHGGSTVWRRATDATGTVTIPSGSLTDGHNIAAYFLYDDGYTSLAPPITFQLKQQAPYDGGPTGPHWVTDAFTVAPVAPGSQVAIAVSGLWFGTDDKPVTAPSLSKTGGDDWLSLGADGKVTGTAPAASAEPYHIEITATTASGNNALLSVDVPVSSSPAQLKTATLNSWEGGSHVTNPIEKLTKTILLNRFDVLGLQESSGLAGKVAGKLGWASAENPSGAAVLSRYALQADPAQQPHAFAANDAVAADSLGLHATVQIGEKKVSVWSAALDKADDGPSLACSTDAPRGDALLAKEMATKRYGQAQSLASSMAADLKAKTPLVLLGSLASPSGADWTAAANRCGAGAVQWPVLSQFSAAGLQDAFRAINPDPVAQPGISNSAVGSAAIADRTDYVLFSGKLKSTESHVLIDGFPKVAPNVQGNSWISDHAAVVASFQLLDQSPVAEQPVTEQPGIGQNPDGSAQPPVQAGSDAVNGARLDASPSDPLANTGAEAWFWLLAAVVLITLGGTLLTAKANVSTLFRRSTRRKQKA